MAVTVLRLTASQLAAHRSLGRSALQNGRLTCDSFEADLCRNGVEEFKVDPFKQVKQRDAELGRIYALIPALGQKKIK